MALENLTKEQLEEMSLIEVASEIFTSKKQSYTFGDLVKEIVAIKGITEEEVRSKLAQFYTDLNIDGRFICIGENQWGLREWYPYDQIEEETTPQVKAKTKKKSKKALDDDDLDLEDFDELDEEDLEFDDLDDYEEEDLIEDEDIIDDLNEDDDTDDDELEIIDDEDEFDDLVEEEEEEDLDIEDEEL